MDDIHVHKRGPKQQKSATDKSVSLDNESKERERYGKLSEDVSRVLRNIVLTLLVLVILSQFALRSDGIRQHLSNAEKLEGMPFQKAGRALH
ncbi:hypothetical protein H8B09_08435 [Paenibacillus sp. PR3]|uniref:Uncharacterized protein n=1 Tax=Paenibacillus terricola TaxID=2763503 RepID=A0ABR8MS23_9BACL|nr:hypothetical protein [Paenibacillus terricola]MBD3918774.1 hypothetical protein [Paenibacillus terricola]